MVLGTVALATVALACASVPSAEARPNGTLELSARLVGTYRQTHCLPGMPSTVDCFHGDAGGVVSGLGDVTEAFTLLEDAPSETCRHWSANDIVFTVAGKGRLRLTAANPSCQAPCPCGRMSFTITGGSGIYSGASGGGSVRITAGEAAPLPREIESWTGTLTVPGLLFDLAPPTIVGAVSTTVRVRRGWTSVRVRFAVAAADAVDGSVPVGCLPGSGSRFRIGRTRVTCWADDSSGNHSTRLFTVRVKR